MESIADEKGGKGGHQGGENQTTRFGVKNGVPRPLVNGKRGLLQRTQGKETGGIGKKKRKK